MNERINEIAKQAWNLCSDPHGETSFDALNKFEQKFAELIIQDCADYVDSAISDGGVDGRSLKEYFGVK